MRLHCFDHPNFGDALNRWLWPQLIGDELDDDGDVLFTGIGTLLNDRLPVEPLKIVFGSGVGYGEVPPLQDPSRWRFYFVRGPLSAKALGLPPETAITDGAIALRLLRLAPERKQYAVSFIPHWQSARYWDWRSLCEEIGIHYIDPQGSTQAVLSQIRQSERLIAEAMHGAIVADAFRVPWIPVSIYRQILPFKWEDWCGSLGLRYDPVRLPQIYAPDVVAAKVGSGPKGWAAGGVARAWNVPAVRKVKRELSRLATQGATTLSSERELDRATELVDAQLKQFKADVAAGVFAGSH